MTILNGFKASIKDGERKICTEPLVQVRYKPLPYSQMTDATLLMQGRMPSSTCCPGALTGSSGMLLW